MAYLNILHKEWINNREKIIDKATFTFYFLALIAIVIVIGSYFLILYQYSVNIPFWDDYSHLKVIIDIVNSDSFIEKIQWLFSLHNEHRIAFARLVTLAALRLSGEVNFITLAMLGNLSLLGIVVLLFSTFSKNNSQDFRWRTIYFLPAVLLIFNLSYFEASLWAVAALSSLAVIFLSFLCIFILMRSLERNVWWTLGAFFFGVLSAFTQGNGLLVLYVGIFLLILQKRFTTSIFWGIGAVIISFLYFHNYESYGFHSDSSRTFPLLGTALHYLVIFFGSWSETPFIIGASFLGLFIWLILSGLYKKNIILFGFLTFIFLSALAVTASRYEIGIDQALSSRYKIYSLLFFSILYLSIFEFLEKPLVVLVLRGSPVFIILFLGINVYLTDKVCDNLKARRIMLIRGLVAWQQKGEGLTHWNIDIANKIISKAIQQQIYYPPKLPFSHRRLSIHPHAFDSYNLPVTQQMGWIDVVEHKNKEVYISGWVPIADNETSQVIHVFSPIKTMDYLLKTIPRPDVAHTQNNRALNYSGFQIKLTFSNVKDAMISASRICVAAESNQTPLTLLRSENQNCQVG